MKKFLGLSVITASLLVSSMIGASDLPPQIPISGTVTKDAKTNKATDIEYKVELVKGWNLIGLPGYKPYILKDFFGNKDMVDKIFVYNSKIQNWQSFVTEGEDPSVKTILPGMGYWIKAKIPFSISFKSNIPAQRGVYEKAAVNMPKDLAAAITAANNASSEMPPSIPVMVNSAGGYGDAFADDGSVTQDFLDKVGTTNWDEIDATQYSADDWNEQFIFDIDLLDGAEYTDQVGRKYQFSPLNEKGGKVVIIDGDKTINAKFDINRKGELEIQLKKKEDNANQPAGTQPAGTQPATARVIGAEPVKDGEVGITSAQPINVNKPVDGAKPTLINQPAPKAPPSLRFELIEIEESNNGVVLKLKNIESKQPAKWTLTSFYDDVDGVWEDAATYFAEDIVDEDVADIDWENLTTDDSALNDVLDDEDVENYDDTELNEEFSDAQDAIDDAQDAVDDAQDAVDDAQDAVDDAQDAIDDNEDGETTDDNEDNEDENTTTNA